MNQLVERWHEVAGARGSDLALVEAGSGSAWSFRDLGRVIDERRRALAGARVVFPMSSGAGFVIETLAGWSAGAVVCPCEIGASVPAVPAPDDWPDGVIMAKTTSGTSGEPKLVLFDAVALEADARQIVRTMGLEPGVPNVGTISLAHSYGFSNLVLPLALEGVPLRLAGSPLPESVRRAIGQAPFVVLAGVPAMWGAWEASGMIDSRIVLAISAGAPLPLDLERRVFATTGVKIHNFLGASECGGIAYDRTSTPREVESLAGTAMDGVDLSVGAGGVLEVRSAAVGRGYWPRGGADAERLQPGRFVTTDIAELRPDGCHLFGRSSDAVNLAGRKVHPAELESLLRQHPAVRECLVFSLPSTDPERGEELVACVARAALAGIDGRHLSDWLAAQVAAWKIPRHWWMCDELRANARGKLSRAEWRAAFLRKSEIRNPSRAERDSLPQAARRGVAEATSKSETNPKSKVPNSKQSN